MTLSPEERAAIKQFGNPYRFVDAFEEVTISPVEESPDPWDAVLDAYEKRDSGAGQ